MFKQILKLDEKPKEIQKIIGNEYLFQLHLDEYNLKYGKENYTVSKILETEIAHKQNDLRKVEEHQVIEAHLLHFFLLYDLNISLHITYYTYLTDT